MAKKPRVQNLRDILGDGDEDEPIVFDPKSKVSQLPASELSITPTDIPDEKIEALMKEHLRKTAAQREAERAIAADRAAAKPVKPAAEYIQQGLKTEPLTVVPPEKVMELPETWEAFISPETDPEVMKLDEEYHKIFNGVIQDTLTMSLLELQAQRHKLAKVIRNARIATDALKQAQQRVETSEKDQKTYRERESAFQAPRARAQKSAGTRVASETKKAEAKQLSNVEKQVKQFVSMKMNEGSIRKILSDTKQSIPSNLTELIERFARGKA
jgi:hypothetical protein